MSQRVLRTWNLRKLFFLIRFKYTQPLSAESRQILRCTLILHRWFYFHIIFHVWSFLLKSILPSPHWLFPSLIIRDFMWLRRLLPLGLMCNFASKIKLKFALLKITCEKSGFYNLSLPPNLGANRILTIQKSTSQNSLLVTMGKNTTMFRFPTLQKSLSFLDLPCNQAHIKHCAISFHLRMNQRPQSRIFKDQLSRYCWVTWVKEVNEPRIMVWAVTMGLGPKSKE